jgi:phytoene dehydrogenase-like protein
MADYDAIVIGAGNGGLTAATALAQKGVKTLLLERHNIPGGSATSFCRGRFEFEVALHQLSGLGTAAKPGPLRMTFDKLGVTNDLEFVEGKDLYGVAMPGGFHISLKTDLKETIEILQQRFPKEKENVKNFFDLMGRYSQDMLAVFVFRDPAPTREKYSTLFSYAFRDAESVLDEFFADPLLKTVLSCYWGYLGVPPKRLTFAYIAMLFFHYGEFKPFHIKGGSQALSNALLNRFINAGGTARFSCGAKRIIVEKGAVKAVITDQDEEITTNYIVSNGSQAAAYILMIDPKEVPETVTKDVKSRNISISALVLWAGYDCEPDALGFKDSTSFLLSSTNFSTERIIDNMWHVGVRDDIFAFSCYDLSDPEFSPKGCCQTNLVTLKYGEAWTTIPPAQYYDTKFKCAEEMLKRMEAIYPGIRGHIEEVEFATPLTFMRYLSTPGGAIYGYEQLMKDSLFFQPGRSSPIKGLFFAGGWTGDCGFEPTLSSGFAAATSIIRQLGK